MLGEILSSQNGSFLSSKDKLLQSEYYMATDCPLTVRTFVHFYNLRKTNANLTEQTAHFPSLLSFTIPET